MKVAVVYKFKKYHKLNGTLFYCFEYFHMLKQNNVDTHFLVVDISNEDMRMIQRLFAEKYTADTTQIKSVSVIELFQQQLERTVVLDIHTLDCCFEFFTGEIHCFSNVSHQKRRYTTLNRSITYYGSYPYQSYDIYSTLKLNFDIFKPLTTQGNGVFISSVDTGYLVKHQQRLAQLYIDKPIITKSSLTGVGNIFELIDTVHYIHTCLDTNNRIIPESFFYGKQIVIENEPFSEEDSVKWRYEDIILNGIKNYYLSTEDKIVSACLKY